MSPSAHRQLHQVSTAQEDRDDSLIDLADGCKTACPCSQAESVVLTSSPRSTVRMVSLLLLAAPLSAVLSALWGLPLVSRPGKVSNWMSVAWLTAPESVESLAGWSEVDRDLLREVRACIC